MTSMLTLTTIAGLVFSTLAGAPRHITGEEAVTWTGWFSDLKCATPKVARGEIGPNGTTCVKKCLDEGVTPVFISEQAKALFEARDYSSVKDDVGYYVEVTGVVDAEAKAISISSVKRLAYVGSMCGLPKKAKEDRQRGVSR